MNNNQKPPAQPMSTELESRIARYIKTNEAMKKLKNEAIVTALQATHEGRSTQ